MTTRKKARAAVYPENIPQELKARRDWVVWSWRKDADGNDIKPPFTPGTGCKQKAMINKASTWGTFDQALAEYNAGRCAGIGLAITPGAGLTFIDWDRFPDDHTLSDAAAADLSILGASYTEWSQSGRGVHWLGKGKKPGPKTRSKGTPEIYDKDRFAYLTGDLVDGPSEIAERQSGIDALYARHFPQGDAPRRRAPVAALDLDDQEIVNLATAARNGGKFRALWAGDTSGHGNDHSSADMALCDMLAFYTRDPGQIDRLVRASGLYREKWERNDYRDATITKALDLVTELYTRRGAPARSDLQEPPQGEPGPVGASKAAAPVIAPDFPQKSEPKTATPAELPGPIVPELPESARFDPALGKDAGQWVDVYTAYASAISPMTPKAFHESAAVVLGSMAIARRLKLGMSFGDVYPNIAVLWLAVTTLYRKSTALEVARDTARRVFPHLMAAQDTTPEAFLSDLAGREPPYMDTMTDTDRADWQASRNYAAQKGWILDEMSGLMAASGRDYNAGLVESLLRFYDCDPYYVRSTRGQGRIAVRNAYLSILGASTPAAMASHLSADRLWAMGWWSRFAVLTPEGDRPDWKEARRCEIPEELGRGLRALYDGLQAATWPDPPTAATAQIMPSAFDLWAGYNKAVSHDLLTDDLDVRLYGTYGRLPVQALKVALVLAALDWRGPDVVKVKLCHMARALTICEEWRASAHRVLVSAVMSEFSKMKTRILLLIGRAGSEGPTFRDIYRGMQSKEPVVVKDTIQQMLGLGEILEYTSTGKGRSATRYKIVTE